MGSEHVRELSFYLRSPSNNRFYVKRYLPGSGAPRGIVLLITGMAEHAGRYHDFACYLAENGFGLYACDHPGQGQTAGSPEKVGLIHGRRGWQIMLENVRSLYSHIRKDRPQIPVFLFGHSMGSLIARHFAAIYPVYIQGLVLSGSFTMKPLFLNPLKALVWIKGLIEGPDKKSRWLNNLFYGNFNRHFSEKPTRFEWISSDRKEVDAYEADPYCGFDYSNGFYRHLLRGITATRMAEGQLTYRKTMPILILSGQEDPVGHFGRDALKLHKEYYRQNFQNLSLKIFHGRHELLHEKNKQQVAAYLLQWFNDSLQIR